MCIVSADTTYYWSGRCPRIQNIALVVPSLRSKPAIKKKHTHKRRTPNTMDVTEVGQTRAKDGVVGVMLRRQGIMCSESNRLMAYPIRFLLSQHSNV